MSLVLGVFLTLAGCLAPRGNVELLEEELRVQELRIDKLHRDLMGTKEELRLAHREADLLRQQNANPGRIPILPEQAEHWLRATGVTFHSLLSDYDEKEQVLKTVLLPVDSEGGVVKLPGSIEIRAFDLSNSEDQLIGEWKFDLEKAREIWHAGLVSTGYRLDLPLHQARPGNQITLHAKLTSVDGREFTTQRDFSLTTPQDETKVGFRPSLPSPTKEDEIEFQAPVPGDPETGEPVADEPEAGAIQEGEFEAGDLTDEEPILESDNWTESEIPRLR